MSVNFVWTLAGNVVYAACQWGILVTIAKVGTPEMVGEFALALAITAPVFILSSLSLRSVQATDAAREYLFRDYFQLRLLTTVLALLIVSCIVALTIHSPHTMAVIVIVALSKAFECISDILYGSWQQQERMDRISHSLMIRSVLSLTLVPLGILLTGDLLVGVVGLAVAWGLSLFAFDLRTERLVSGALSAPDFAILFRLGMLAAPAGVVVAVISVGANIPRYYVDHHLGTDQLGIFAALTYPMFAGSTVVCAMAQSASPRLARHYIKGELAGFAQLLIKVCGLGLLVGVVGTLLIVFAGSAILQWIYGSEYAEHTSTFLWLAIGTTITYVGSILGYAMTAARYLRAQLPVFVVVMVVTAIGCSVLVPQGQLKGAAMAIAMASLFQVAGSAAVITHALTRWRPVAEASVESAS
jgi:O-antigen/teichoic acid export membrane protein